MQRPNMPNLSNLKPNFSGFKMPKIGVPAVILVVAIAAYVVIQRWNLDPEIIRAKAEWATANVGYTDAWSKLLLNLPQALQSASMFVLAVMGGAAAFAILFSFAWSLVLWSTSGFLRSGISYTKNDNGKVTTMLLVRANDAGGNALPSGQRGRPADIHVENPMMSGGGRPDALPRGGDRQIPSNVPFGKRLDPNERKAPGRGGGPNQQQPKRDQQLASGMPPRAPSSADPLSDEISQILGG